MPLLSVETCPFKCRLYWYAADWYRKTAFVFNTKPEALEKQKEIAETLSGFPYAVVNVSWIENSMNRTLTDSDFRFTIGREFSVTDCRRKA